MQEKTESRINLNRVHMPRQDPIVRAHNYNEVALGYTREMAVQEASRCIQCPKRMCVSGCPVNVDIPEFVRAVQEGNMPEAVRILKSKNSLPAICGRVCPQETQCEQACLLAKEGAPIAIGRIERYVADWDLCNKDNKQPIELPPPTGRKVAVIGSGPAGLTAAADLAKYGHKVTIFEALHTAGGVLMYGIPEFRLPKNVVQAEVNYVHSLGVNIQLDSVMGKLATVDELLGDGFDAVFLGTGAGLPIFLDIPGEHLNGVYSANEFLTRTNLMRAHLFPEYDTPIKIGKKVAVIGGGNVAMDAARCALRLGADIVYIVYRRSRKEMPARFEEVENAEHEGIVFKMLTSPRQIIGDDKGWVMGLECCEMELGEPDASGRRRPIVKQDSEFIMEVDVVVIAIGTTPNPLIPSTTIGLDTTEHGTVVVNEDSGKTVKDRVWAGGDVVTGAATIISAMGAGKRAAAAIHEFLSNH